MSQARRLVALFAFALAVALAAAPAVASEAIVPIVSAAAESSHILCDATGAAPRHKAPCFLRSIYVTTGAVPGYLMTFNAVTAPSNGAVTPTECVYIPASATVSVDFGETSEPYGTGLTAVFSSTGCFTQTLSATAFFKARVQ